MYFTLSQYHAALKQTDEWNLKSLELEKEHYKNLQKKNEDLRAFRHDYNHHILALQELTAKEDWNTLKNYIKNLSTIKEHTYYLSTNNAIGDAIINYFYETASDDINFKLNGRFPDYLFITESDLCILLSNSLTNAIEGVQKLSDTKTKEIYVEISAANDEIILIVENSSIPYSKQELEQLNTTKTDTRNHGFGIRNMKKIVEKYHGVFNVRWNDGLFSVYILLKNT